MGNLLRRRLRDGVFCSSWSQLVPFVPASPSVPSHCRLLSASFSVAMTLSRFSASRLTLASSHLVKFAGVKAPLEMSHQQCSSMGIMEGIFSRGRSGILYRNASAKVVMFTAHGRTSGVSMGTGGQ